MQIVINISDDEMIRHSGESMELSIDIGRRGKVLAVWNNEDGYKEYTHTIIKEDK
jgi:hypothetical protein